jgi:hypothetical protein
LGQVTSQDFRHALLKFSNFCKIKKRCKPSEMRTKPNIFGKFEEKLNLKIFKNSQFCAFFGRFAKFYHFSKFFEEIEISQNFRNFKKIKNAWKWRETRRKLRIFEIFEKN